MKKIWKSLIAISVSVSLSTNVIAQQNETEDQRTPKWISDKGYWVIESNIKTPQSSVIHFYNTDNTKIYSEKVEGVKLNIKKRKTLMQLKKALDESLMAWGKSKLPYENQQVVKNILKQP